MSSGSNKCVNCGQWAGRGHKCPTPSTPAIPNEHTADAPALTSDDRLRMEVEARVHRARLFLDGPLYHGTPQPLDGDTVWPTEQIDNWSAYFGQEVAFATRDISEARLFGPYVYEVYPDKHTEEGFAETYYSEQGFKVARLAEGPNSVNTYAAQRIRGLLTTIQGTALIGNHDAATIRRMIDRDAPSDNDTVAAAIAYSEAMTTTAQHNADRMAHGRYEYVEDEQAELVARLESVQDLTDYMTDKQLDQAAMRINGWTKETLASLVNNPFGIPPRNLLFKNGEVPFQSERHYFSAPSTTDDTYSSN